MTNRELVIETLAHRNPGKVPQAIHLTGEGYQAYGAIALSGRESIQGITGL